VATGAIMKVTGDPAMINLKTYGQIRVPSLRHFLNENSDSDK
jgi:hypothetical protein